MRKYLVFAIRDNCVDRYMLPFYAEREAAAVRMFADCVTDASHEISKHPEDYALYMIGDYDADRGVLTPMMPVKLLSSGSAFVRVPAVAPELPLQIVGGAKS